MDIGLFARYVTCMYKSGLIDSSDAIYRHHFRGHLFVFAVHYSPLQGIALTPSPFLPLSEESFRFKHTNTYSLDWC